jgi:cytochrome c peroxidase
MFLFFRRSKRLLRNTLKLSVAGSALLCVGGGVPPFAFAQNSAYDPANYAWQSGAIRHAQKMRAYSDSDRGEQLTPPVIPKFEIDFDPSGLIATAQPGGPTLTSQNAFFGNLGTNGRTCFTCHQPQNGWSVSAASVQARFYASFGTDPIFRLVDGATCPSDDVSSIDAKHQSYGLLLSKGLIRIGLPIPATAQFRVAAVDDPYNCNTNPVTGLTSPTTGIVSVYRRPLPAVNLGFLSAIMWDGREPSLLSQAVDATLGHAQAIAAPSAPQQQQIVNFETGIFTAQLFDNKAKFLNDDGATGGPIALQKLLPGFFIGINDPLGLNPKGTPFTSKIFDLYRAWKNIGGSGDVAAYRRSVARGEDLFNNTPINITNVGGLNDALNQPSIPGFCGTCHDTPDVGNHSVKAPLNIGIANAGAGSPPALNISDLPVFTLQCVTGPLAGKSFVVTDPGRALISGACADIGKLKGPILRGLAGRAPYFHNGSAATLLDAVNFYDERFNIGFTEQDRRDLAAFLQTL